MLHIDIQKGKNATKTSNFQKDLGGTTACMKRIAIATKGCGQLTSNNTYFVNSWFSSIKKSEEMEAAGVEYCDPVKTMHDVFLFEYVRKFDERLSGRVISCYGEYSNISLWKTTTGHWVQVKF